MVEFVEGAHGLELTDRWLDSCQLESGGAFVATDSYPMSELGELVTRLSETLDAPLPDLLRAFGEHLFGYLASRHGHVMERIDDPLQLFENLENHVHVEVRKLYPDAEVPRFQSERLGEDEMRLVYESSRGLADLAHGLILGAGRHFDCEIDIARRDLSEGAGTQVEFLLSLGDVSG